MDNEGIYGKNEKLEDCIAAQGEKKEKLMVQIVFAGNEEGFCFGLDKT